MRPRIAWSFPNPRAARLVACCLALVVSACSSEEFGPTGSSLPADVRQDSLLIPLEIVGAVDELRLDLPRVDPPQGESIELRDFLYFGTLSETDWKATPFLRFGFTNPDSLDTQFLRDNPDSLLRIDILFRMARWDAERGARMQISLYELNAPLEPAMAEGSVASYLGPKLGDYSVLRGKTVSVDLLEGLDPGQAAVLKSRMLDWIEAEGQDGLAFVDAATDSSLVGLAGTDFDFSRYGRLLSTVESVPDPVVRPRITMAYRSPGAGAGAEDYAISFESASDLTVFERSGGGTDLALGGHLPARCWFDFDLSALPRAATINGAELVLSFDRSRLAVTGFPGTEIEFDLDEIDTDLIDRSDGDRTFSESTLAPITKTALVFESTRAQAEALNTTSLSQVQDALSGWRPDFITTGTLDGDDELHVNVTDFVQRVVNGIFGSSPPGLLVAVTGEEVEFFEAVVFDSAAADSLKPRLEIRYTPPADFTP